MKVTCLFFTGILTFYFYYWVVCYWNLNSYKKCSIRELIEGTYRIQHKVLRLWAISLKKVHFCAKNLSWYVTSSWPQEKYIFNLSETDITRLHEIICLSSATAMLKLFWNPFLELDLTHSWEQEHFDSKKLPYLPGKRLTSLNSKTIVVPQPST